MTISVPARSRVVPARAPWLLFSCGGSARRDRGAAAFGCRAGSAFRDRSAFAAALDPHRSARITPTAAMASSHSTARGVLEPHPYRAHEGVTLFLRVLTSEIGEFLAQTVGVHREPFTVGMRDLDDEVVRHQRATLRDDGRALVHLTLDRAGDLHRLQLRLESPSEGTLHHAFEPALEAL